MSKQLTIINSANVYAQNFMRSIRGYNKIVLGDLANSRKTFHINLHNLKAENSDINYSHLNINSNALLEEAIMDADTVLYFSHDYFSRTIDKNTQLEAVSNITKEYKTKKFIAVTPLEFINYQKQNINENPIKELNDSISNSQKINEKSTIIKTDINFGNNCYLIKFLSQSWNQSYSYLDHNLYKHYKFSPIFNKDFNLLLQTVLEDMSNEFEGKKYNICGKEQISFYEIDNLIKQAYFEQDVPSTPIKLLKSFNQSRQLFFHGNNHAINFEKMLEFLNGKENMNEGFIDLNEKLNYKPKAFREYYSELAEKLEKEKKEKKELQDKNINGNKEDLKVDQEKSLYVVEENDLRVPLYFKYWNLSLD